jgi:hypothetical protein
MTSGKKKTSNTKTLEPAEEKKSSRQQVSKLIGINLSVSRVRKYVDKNNVNREVEAACQELRNAIATSKDKSFDRESLSESTKGMIAKAYSQIYEQRLAKNNATRERLTKSGSAEDAKKLKELKFHTKTETLEEALEYVSKLRCRFSNNSAVVLSSVLDYVVQDIVRTAMIQARSQGKAIIQISHVANDTFNLMSTYPLVSQLPVVEEAMRTDVADSEDADESAAEPAEESTNDPRDTTFEFYVNLICKSVKAQLVSKDEQYAPVRISKYIRKFCSDVVIQLIERLSPLIVLYASTTGIKTIGDEVIMFWVKALLMDAGVDSTDLFEFVHERLESYKKKPDTE